MDNEWQITNKGDLYTLKITDEEGVESMMLTVEQLAKLKVILSSLNVPLPQNELPL